MDSRASCLPERSAGSGLLAANFAISSSVALPWANFLPMGVFSKPLRKHTREGARARTHKMSDGQKKASLRLSGAARMLIQSRVGGLLRVGAYA